MNTSAQRCEAIETMEVSLLNRCDLIEIQRSVFLLVSVAQKQSGKREHEQFGETSESYEDIPFNRRDLVVGQVPEHENSEAVTESTNH